MFWYAIFGCIPFWGTGVTRFGFICEALGRRLFLDSGKHSESKGSQLGSFLEWGTPKSSRIDYQWENQWEKGYPYFKNHQIHMESIQVPDFKP
jgi:hypothetical protein